MKIKVKVLAAAAVALMLLLLVVCNGKAGLYEQAPDVAYITLGHADHDNDEEDDLDMPNPYYVAIAGQNGNEDAGR